MHTVQTIGLPRGDAPAADAIVVALKSRTIPAADAVAQSLAACRWLKANGARQIFFKYCSTFDSTDAGNIGPVADALLDELGAGFTIACPAFPENGRTIYLGHLFVGDELLSDSSMRNHPLTPMRDANLVRVLGRQTPHKVGLVSYAEVKQRCAGDRRRLCGPAGGGRTPRHRRCRGGYRPREHRRGLHVAAAGDGRLGRCTRPSGQLHPHRQAQAAGWRKAACKGRWPCRRAGRQLLGRDAGRRSQRCVPRHPAFAHRSHGPARRSWRRCRGGPRLGRVTNWKRARS